MAPLILPSPVAVERELGRRNVLDFTRRTFQSFKEAWYHAILSYYLTQFALGTITRLMLFMPPRHGKTEFSSRRMPAFILGRNPDARIIGCSYGQDLAGDISNDVQRIMHDPEFELMFPNARIGGKETERMFTLADRRGYYRAAGIGGPIGGYGAGYGLIDDPIKNSEEAESKVYRDRIWNWYKSTFYPRLEEPGSILLTTTRWNEDDLAGRLLKEQKENADADKWVVVNLPAIFEVIKNEAGEITNSIIAQDKRAPGEALWPERFPLERLNQIRGVLGSYWFSALYQGIPQPAGGSIFKREWLTKIIPATSLPTSNMKWCRYWDAAGTEGAGDYTAGVKMGYHEPTKHIFIAHVVRGQWSTGTVDDQIKAYAKMDGYNCRIREEQEGGSSGVAVVNKRQTDLIGYDYRGHRKTGSKETAYKPLSAQCEAGNVFIVQGPWNTDFIDELVGVPTGAHDDQADAAAGGFNELVVGPGDIQVVKLAGFG